MRDSKQQFIDQIRELEQKNSELNQRLQVAEKSEKFHRITLESISDTVIITDRGGSFIYVCPNTEAIFGLSQNEVLNKKTIEKLMNGHLYNKAELYKKGELENIEWSLEDLYGRYKFLLIDVKLMDKNCESVLYIMRDITDRKQHEENLKTTHSRLDNTLKLLTAIISSVPVPLFYKDGEGRYLGVNDAFCELMGFTPDYYIGKTVMELWPTELSEVYHNKDLELMRNPQRQVYEFRVLDKNRNLRQAVWSKDVFRDENGKVMGIVGAFQDITERKRFEDALKESEEYLCSILNTLADPVCVKDINHRWVLVNEKFCEIAGLARNDLIGKSDYDFFPRNEADIFWKMDNEVFQRGEENFNEETLTNAATGETVILSTKKTLYTNNKGEKFVVAVGRDITEFRKLQKALQQAQKMEAIGTLAGGIAHDFNNILFPIIGMSELLMDDLPPDSLLRENAMTIFKAGQRGSELVKQILAFSRQQDIRKLPLRIQLLLKEVLKLSRSTIPANIEIKDVIQSDCGSVEANPTQVHQIAMNLITNAYHAVEPTGGEIIVQLKEVRLKPGDLPESLLKPGRYAVLTVSDTGCGIDSAVIDKIFDPYFTTKDKGKGTGLGLAVVYGIVKEYHGEIRVTSEMGKGATFDVYLPILEKTVQTGSVKACDKNFTGNERILLVDDESVIVQLEKRILERLGYQVTDANSSIDALKVFQENPGIFDLAITDMNMPNMTGVQLAEKLIAIKPDIPIILCTGFSERINKERAESIGIKGFLMKPVARSEMIEMVRNVLDDAIVAAQGKI